jgi:hypothetical protein
VLARALQRLLARDVYIQVFKDRIWVRDLETGLTLDEVAPRPFSTRRLLVGDFAAAEAHLRGLFSRLYAGRMITPSPRAIIQARELNEGGLSPVEERVLMELAEGAGARQTMVHDGSELSDISARELLRSRAGGA